MISLLIKQRMSPVFKLLPSQPSLDSISCLSKDLAGWSKRKVVKKIILSRGNPTDNAREEGDMGLRGKRILWIDPFAIDDALHKVDTLEILTGLSGRGLKTYLMATRSKRVLKTDEDSQIHLIVTPLRYVPMLSPVMFAILLFFLLPFSIAEYKPDFIVARPDISNVSLIPSLLFSRLRGTKFVLDVRSTPVETSGFRGFLQKLWFAPSIVLAKRFFDGLTAISMPMKREICESFRIDLSKVGVWTSGSPSIYLTLGIMFAKALN